MAPALFSSIQNIMRSPILVRPIAPSDLAAWRPLWDGLTHTTNAPGRALYDRVAEHKGFIVYGQDF